MESRRLRMNMSEQASPGTRFPPPVAFGAGLASGFLLQHFLPVPLLEASKGNLLKLVGGILVIAGVTLALWAILAFRRAHTTVRPDRPSVALVTHGPFRFTRNPMYFSLSVVYTGITLLANALWPLLLLAPVLLVIRYYVIAREERYLLARFGADYGSYRRRVRRWL
jgi:protein-S-isoprenylcysteine O-methyltransferase Ste14